MSNVLNNNYLVIGGTNSQFLWNISNIYISMLHVIFLHVHTHMVVL